MELAETFMQGLPENGDWQMVRGDNRSGQLAYEDRNTGRVITVPNVWYNQPVTWRVHQMRWYAEREDQFALRLMQSRDPFERMRSRDAQSRAARCRAIADEMERSGRVVA